MDNHVILLRVNQYIDHPTQKNRNALYEGNPSWIDIRLNWLEKYLLHNLQTQQDKGLWCFMLSDPETPETYKNRIKKYEDLGFIKVLETNHGDGDEYSDKLILDTYKSVRKNNSDEIICSRLDTDDMVGPYWNVAVKQMLSLENNVKRVSLETVLLYNFINEETRVIKFSKGSFVSTISKLDNWDNPRSFPHGSSEALSVDTEYPLVCMGIHDNNVTNQNWWPAGARVNIEKNQFNQMFKIKR